MVWAPSTYLAVYKLFRIYFLRKYSPSDSHTNTVNFNPTCRSTQTAARGAIFFAEKARVLAGTVQAPHVRQVCVFGCCFGPQLLFANIVNEIGTTLTSAALSHVMFFQLLSLQYSE